MTTPTRIPGDTFTDEDDAALERGSGLTGGASRWRARETIAAAALGVVEGQLDEARTALAAMTAERDEAMQRLTDATAALDDAGTPTATALGRLSVAGRIRELARGRDDAIANLDVVRKHCAEKEDRWNHELADGRLLVRETHEREVREACIAVVKASERDQGRLPPPARVVARVLAERAKEQSGTTTVSKTVEAGSTPAAPATPTLGPSSAGGGGFHPGTRPRSRAAAEPSIVPDQPPPTGQGEEVWPAVIAQISAIREGGIGPISGQEVKVACGAVTSLVNTYANAVVTADRIAISLGIDLVEAMKEREADHRREYGCPWPVAATEWRKKHCLDVDDPRRRALKAALDLVAYLAQARMEGR